MNNPGLGQLEAGTDIRIIQEPPGHVDITTTLRYTHVSQPFMQQVQSPPVTLCSEKRWAG